MSTASAVECPACGGTARPLSTITYNGTTATITRCGKCQRKDGRLVPGLGDPPEVVAYVRRRMNKALAVGRPCAPAGPPG